MSRQYPPGPQGNLLLGSMRPFQRDPLTFLLDGAKTYGDIYSFRLGPYRIHVLNNSDYAHEVLIRQAKAIQKTEFNRALLARIMGNGILTSEGDFHRRQRRLVQPAFHHQRLANYAGTMVDFASKMLEGWRAGQTLDIEDEMMKLTMQIVSKTLFDAEVSVDGDNAADAIAILQSITIREFKAGFMLPEWLPVPRNRQRRLATHALDEIVLRFIHERRASGEDTGDLLSMLLQAQDEDDGSTMTDTQVRDEAVTLFAAGHETTSNALTWTWYLLSQHPDVEAKLHAELESVLGGRSPSLDDLPQLKYTEMVIKESMRLYPPVWLLMSRTPLEPITIGGYRMNPGEWIFVAPYTMHRKSEYFENPDRFDPERFAEEREAALPRYAYFPFGGGQRICIGNGFAMMEARLILATVAQQRRLSLVPGQQIVPEPEITLRPRYGLNMTIHARQRVTES